MEIKTIWQPVEPWPEGTVLKQTKYYVEDRLPRIKYEQRVLAPRFYKAIGYRNTNEMRKWILNG